MTKINGKEQLYRIKDTSNARDVVLFVLLNVTENKRMANVCLRETLAQANGLSEADRAFVTRAVNGTLDYLIRIDYIISKYARTPLLVMKPVIKAILRMSVYQILFMERIPKSAACNEAVKLAKLHGFSGLSGFVNGVLRNIVRDQESGSAKLLTFPDPATRYAVPKWLYKKMTQDFGAQRAEAVASAWLLERQVTVRFQISRASEEEILSRLEEDGVSAERVDMRALLQEACSISGENAGIFRQALNNLDSSDTGNDLPALWKTLPVCFRLPLSGNLASLRAFQEGLITAQDPAAALAAWASGASAGDFVIDICAAPGGKSMALSDLLHQDVRIEARDLSLQKTELIDENIKRCGFSNSIHTRVMDALIQDEDSFSRADVLIADLPCSGLGIAGRKPDIKRNLKPYSFQELLGLQRDILTAAAPYVRPHGKLLYATCTLTPEENEETAAFAAQNLGFHLLGMLRLWPGKTHDGFFMALLERKH